MRWRGTLPAMWRRRIPMFLACTLVTAACGQEPPARQPLPGIPDEFVFPTVTSTTADPVPDDGTCYLVESTGAYVSSIQPGYDAGNILQPGDVITVLGEAMVTSQETLIAAVSARAPGERLQISFQRDDEVVTAEVELGSLPEDPARPRLGVLVEPSLTATPPDELTGEGPAVTPSTHVMVVEDSLVGLDPLAGTWFPTGAGDPGSGIVLIDGQIYVQDAERGPSIVPVEGGDPVPVETAGLDLLRILATVGDILVVFAGDIDADLPGIARNATVLGVDLGADRIAWSWAPQGTDGEPANPVFGVRSPDGERAVLTMEAGGATVLTLIDATGTLLAGFGTDTEIAPAGAVFGGWHDDQTLAYIVAVDGELSLQLFDLTAMTASEGGRFEATETLRQIWSAGDGNHVVLVTAEETRLYDLADRRDGRLLARNCLTAFIAGPTT